jgi:D-arabinose 1-dehydrogenase-like Zn-dependent alcohol dehydrogenase
MVLPQRYFLTKEISVKGSFAYNDKDFKETVEAFTEGEYTKEIQDAVHMWPC